MLGPIKQARHNEGKDRRTKENMDLAGVRAEQSWNMEWFDYLDTLAMLDIAEIVADQLFEN